MLECACCWEKSPGRPYLRAVPPFPKVGTPAPRRRWLTEVEERDVLRAILGAPDATEGNRPGYLWGVFHSFVIFLLDTGRRKTEALTVTADDVRGDLMTVRTSKNGDPRTAPLTTRARERFLATAALLPPGSDRPVFGYFLTPSRVFEMWDIARQRAGVPDVTIHDLRRTRGSRLVQAGVDVFTTSRLLGHRDSRITERVYGHLAVDNLRAAVRRAEEGEIGYSAKEA